MLGWVGLGGWGRLEAGGGGGGGTLGSEFLSETRSTTCSKFKLGTMIDLYVGDK